MGPAANDGDDSEQGGPESVDAFYEYAYRELRQLARARLRASGPSTLLDTTMLVHESYLRISHNGKLAFPDRARFLVYAGQAMRSIIVDIVRQRKSEKHGGALARVTLHSQPANGLAGDEESVLRVHEALDRLAGVDERMANVVQMRYFAGLTEVEIAEALGVTDRTVRRDWEHARLFLADALQ